MNERIFKVYFNEHTGVTEVNSNPLYDYNKNTLSIQTYKTSTPITHEK